MKLCVTGSIATDHLMTFAGKFSDSLIEEQLDKLSVSFRRRPPGPARGVAANIAFSLGRLDLDPILVGAVGLTSLTTGRGLSAMVSTSNRFTNPALHTPHDSSVRRIPQQPNRILLPGCDE